MFRGFDLVDVFRDHCATFVRVIVAQPWQMRSNQSGQRDNAAFFTIKTIPVSPVWATRLEEVRSAKERTDDGATQPNVLHKPVLATPVRSIE